MPNRLITKMNTISPFGPSVLVNLILLCLIQIREGAVNENKTITDASANKSSVNEMNLSEYSTINDTFALLQDGEKHLNLRDNRDIILVLGNTGSGKSTLTQFIAGDNSKLSSIEVEEDTGEYIIVDTSNKIGTGINSMTILPERLFDKLSKMSFLDSPGFSDTRNAAFDIAANYFLKKTVDHIKTVKLVLAVSYSSVRTGVDRIDFMKLVRHANEFIKDSEKFKNSIVLAVTKVDMEYKVKAGKLSFVGDEIVIKKIGNYIKDVRNCLQNSFDAEKDPERQKFYKKGIFLADIFLTKNQGKYSKIAIFRRPDVAGTLTNIPLLVKEKKYIKGIIDKMVFVKKSENDFGFTISDSSKHNILTLVSDINKHISLDVSKAINDMRDSFELKTIKSENIYIVLEDIVAFLNKITEDYEKLKKCSTHREFVLKFTNCMNTLDVSKPRHIFLGILKKYRYMEFLELVSNEKFQAQSLTWLQPLRTVITYVGDFKMWYKFLIDLYEKMSNYKMYTSLHDNVLRTRIKKMKRTMPSVEIDKFIDNLKDFQVSYYDSINNSVSNNVKQRTLDNIFRAIYNDIVTFSCLNTDTLVIKGDFVKFKDMNSNNPCSGKVKTLKIFALNAVFIDADLIKIGENLNVIVAAPVWEVSGVRKIVLDGLSPKNVFLRKPPNGVNGRPGLPGGAAGNFIGVGSKLINAEYLTITTNGGMGSSGEDGGDGIDGVSGEVFMPTGSFREGKDIMSQNFKYDHTGSETRNIAEDFAEAIGYAAGVYHQMVTDTYTIYGTMGTDGGTGGMGGGGGMGGRKGKIFLYGLNGKEMVSTSERDGSNGNNGAPGAGGRPGKHGDIVTVCFKTKKVYWIGIRTRSIEKGWHDSGEKSISRGEASFGKINKNINYQGIRNPDGINHIEALSLINDYKVYLLRNINNDIKSHLLMKFYSQLNNDVDIKNTYDSIVFFQELQNLENIYYATHDCLNMQDIYESLMTRIDEYSRSPKDYEKTLHSKKILSYLRTTTLSKLLGLKKQSHGDLVINIDSYLKLISDSIERIKSDTKEVAIKELKVDYRKKIDQKIERAQNYIKNLIIPDLQETELAIGHQLDKLIGEIIELQNQSTRNRYELIKKQQELENNMKVKGILGILNVFSGVAKFFGPVGQLIGVATDATHNVVENMLLDHSTINVKGALSIPKGVESMLAEGTTFLENFIGKKIAALQHFSDTVLQETQNSSETLKDLTTVVSNIKSNLTSLDPKQTGPCLSSIAAIIGKAKVALSIKVGDVKVKCGEGNNLKCAKGKTLKDFKQIFGKALEAVDLFTDIYLAHRNDRTKIEQISNAISNENLNINKLIIYQQLFYETAFPVFETVRKILFESTKDLASKSTVALRMLRRDVLKAVNEMKEILGKITKGFKMHENVLNSVAELEEAFILLLKVYENIGHYDEQKELADYIANINSVQSDSIKTDNSTINDALMNLDIMIQSGIVLEQFRKAVANFKQYIFPFANYYSQDYNVSPQMDSEENLKSLVCLANRQIENLKRKLMNHQYTIQKNFDNYIEEGYFQRGEEFSGPFFVWDSDNFEGSISKLLSGEEVVFKSDILTSTHEKNAIKFNKIGIRFGSAEKSIMDALEKQLKIFDVTMKHSGNSYYRCDNTFYLITSDSQTMFHSFEKDGRGKPIRSNKVYTKITNGDYMLSPYTTWTIQLKHVKNGGMKTLDQFKGKVDLELIGHGQYVTAENNICNNDLKKIYQTVDTISVADILIEKS